MITDLPCRTCDLANNVVVCYFHHVSKPYSPNPEGRSSDYVQTIVYVSPVNQTRICAHVQYSLVHETKTVLLVFLF